MKIRLFTPQECLKFWDECKPIRSGKLFWLSVRKCIECAVEQDEMFEKSHIVLDEFVGKFAGSKVFIDNGNHDEEVRNKTIEEYDNFIAKNKGTIDYVTNRPCVKIDGLRIFAKESFMEQMKGGNNEQT